MSYKPVDPADCLTPIYHATHRYCPSCTWTETLADSGVGVEVQRLVVVPVVWADVLSFVTQHHRHHRKPVGMKFCLGIAAGDEIVGVASVGRPVARAFDDGWTLEVNRTCVVDAPNGNSMLYGACWRAAKAIGYRRLITYTQAGESGTSLRAAGWRVVAERPARQGWDAPSRTRTLRGTENVQRTLWEVA